MRNITLLLFIIFNGINGFAQPVLTVDTTFHRGNLEIDLREANSVLTGNPTDKANEIFSFFEQKIYPQIPDALQQKLFKRSIKILFQKNLDKAAIFTGKVSDTDALTIDVRATLVNDPDFLRILSHEWFHALHFAIHPDEPSWVREGMAQVFEYMTFGTYNGPNLIEGLENSTTPLDYSFNIAEQNREAYGHAFLYFYYLFQKCGKEPLFWKLAESQPGQFSEQTINWALSKVATKPGYCADFKSSLIHAELARVHNRRVKDPVETDEYFIIPKLILSIKNIYTFNDVAKLIPTLPHYEPVLFQGSAAKALQKLAASSDWVVFTLGQSTPYSVKPGLAVSATSSPPDLIFIMKTR